MFRGVLFIVRQTFCILAAQITYRKTGACKEMHYFSSELGILFSFGDVHFLRAVISQKCFNQLITGAFSSLAVAERASGQSGL